MQQNEYSWIEKWYQQTTDYVILFTQQWEKFWQNRDCPMLRHTENARELLGFSQDPVPKPGTVLFPYMGELYSAQIDRHSQEDEILYLVRIARQPFQETAWHNPAWRQERENQIAAMRQKIFGISNAVTELYQTIEESSDAYSRMILEELMEQLNIIKGNCCRMMQPSLLWNEMSKYYQSQDISSEAFFLDRELSNFVESCHMVLGRSLRMHLESESHLRIFANRKRLQNCLLCLIMYIRQQRPDITQIYWAAQQQDEQIILTCTAESDGTDDAPNRHSSLEQLYETPLVTPEETVIRLFCKTYHTAVLYTNLENHMVCTLRFPVCSPDVPLSLQSPSQILQDDAFSPFQIFLSDISAYRFY